MQECGVCVNHIEHLDGKQPYVFEQLLQYRCCGQVSDAILQVKIRRPTPFYQVLIITPVSGNILMESLKLLACVGQRNKIYQHAVLIVTSNAVLCVSCGHDMPETVEVTRTLCKSP